MASLSNQIELECGEHAKSECPQFACDVNDNNNNNSQTFEFEWFLNLDDLWARTLTA